MFSVAHVFQDRYRSEAVENSSKNKMSWIAVRLKLSRSYLSQKRTAPQYLTKMTHIIFDNKNGTIMKNNERAMRVISERS